MFSKQDAKNIVDKVFAKTSYYATIVIDGNEKNTTRFANSEINQNVSITDTNLTLTLHDGKKSARCTGNVLTDEGISALLSSAEDMLKIVPDGEYPAFEFSIEQTAENMPSGKLFEEFAIEKRAHLIKEGVSSIHSGFNGAGALNLNRNVLTVASSSGGFRYSAYDYVDFNVVVTHEDGTAGSGKACSYTSAPDIMAQIAKAQATAKAARGAVSPKLGAHTVVLSPNAFADLVFFMCYMLNAKSVIDGVSFATGKLGQKVFGENFTVFDAVGHAELMPLSFDLEGNPKRPLVLVEHGVIKSLAYDNASAKKLGAKPTGHCFALGQGGYPMHICINGGDKSLDEIIAQTNKGVFINEFHYTNFTNPRSLQLTGLTRNGAFLIEGGKLTKPLETVRFTQSLIDAFKSITAISSERKLVPGYVASLIPGVRIENFHFTSKA